MDMFVWASEARRCKEDRQRLPTSTVNDNEEDRCTETALLKCRRQATSKEVDARLKTQQEDGTFSFDVGLVAVPEINELEFDDSIQKEIKFLKTKEWKATSSALRENQLLPSEVTHELQVFAKAEETAQVNAQRARERTNARESKRIAGLSFAEIKENVKESSVIVSAAVDVTDDALE